MKPAPHPITRILSGDKVIDSRLLNVLGAQAFRTVSAQLVHSMRRVPVGKAVATDVDELRAQGLLVMNAFMPQQCFEGILEECAFIEQQSDRTLTTRQGPVTHTAVGVAEFGPRLLPRICEFLADKRLVSILRAVEKWPFGELAHYAIFERLLREDPQTTAAEDPQTRLHSDIFFASHKAWLYLDEVRLEDGPLAYVRRSHRLTSTRLFEIYRDSHRRDRSDDPSRRIRKEERDHLDQPETVVICPPNTLVIANVCGYHRRLSAAGGGRRRALAVSLRSNPFLAHALRARLAEHAGLYELLRGVKRKLAGFIVRDNGL